jgi:Nucleotidyltransferase domain
MTRAITPTLDGPVLAVLAQAGRPMTVGQIAAEVVRGSEIGVRRSVGRLVEQGVVRATQMGRNQVHELNREHIAAPAAELLGGFRLELWRRLREALNRWDPKPEYACAFGSAARGDGGVDSDIDILLVHRPFPEERPPQKGSMWASFSFTPLTAAQVRRWERQSEGLQTKVLNWTGNALHSVDIPTWQWTLLDRTDPALVAEIERDAVTLAGKPKLR